MRTDSEHPQLRGSLLLDGAEDDELTRGQQTRPSAQLPGLSWPWQEGNQGHTEDFAAEPGKEAGREARVSAQGIAEQELCWYQCTDIPANIPGEG